MGVGLCTRTGGYFRAMSNITLIIVIVVAVAIIVALVVAGYQMARRKRTERLRQLIQQHPTFGYRRLRARAHVGGALCWRMRLRT